MSTASFSEVLPSPNEIRARIDACEEELKALRRLLRASVAAARADEARQRRRAVTTEGGERHAT
jgi:hypothetical protein